MSRREQIVKEAEDRARVGGYGHFSFREIADAIGIKSASVHYHFPTKADLGAELARQYTEKFMLSLENASSESDENSPSALDVFAQQFRHSLVVDKKMCLCGMLGAESDALPEAVQQETKAFFEKNIEWLTRALTDEQSLTAEQAHKKAIKAISILEGALLLSRTLGDNSAFDLATDQLDQI